ncbi:MAG: arginine deiminase [Deltaproteobacteria bacterium CG2_30_63_29]|nr:MAG: arginine deiminase [Deltaproteobacteria bacterium CG2_30_63_29]
MNSVQTGACVLDIRSETDPLEQVIVHTPGEEMELVSPSALEQMLMEDILFVSQAKVEHQRMCAVFEEIVPRPGAVLQLSNLLREAFVEADARESFVEELCAVATDLNLQAFERELKSLDAQSLCRFALTGVSPLPIHANPLPNLMFTRDVACIVRDRIILSHPATGARRRESVIMRTVARHHPALLPYRNHIINLPAGVTFEGGDLLVVDEKTVLIGHSERSSFGAVMSVARELLDSTPIESIIVVNLPKKRACMHLDTVFTFISPDECVVYPPIIDVSGVNNVLRLTAGTDPKTFTCTMHYNLKEALEFVLQRPLTFYACGGRNRLNQEREQWTDGANFFALAPSVVIGYDRNSRTFEELRKAGYHVVSVDGFLSYHAESDFAHGEKIAIKLDGDELSRGRGGPRCMTMPLARRAGPKLPESP